VASGAGEAIEARIKALGTNVFVVMPGSFTSGGRRAGRRHGRAVVGRRPCRHSHQGSEHRGGGHGERLGAGRGRQRQLDDFGQRREEDFLEVRDWPLADGRTFTDAELRSGAKVVILGATTAPELFSQGVLRSASMSASRMCPSP
jgi:putative ABC transport system permease protein